MVYRVVGFGINLQRRGLRRHQQQFPVGVVDRNQEGGGEVTTQVNGSKIKYSTYRIGDHLPSSLPVVHKGGNA